MDGDISANAANLPENETKKRKHARPKKKRLREAILKQIEFYFSDAALAKERYLANLIKEDPFIPIELFLKFNKIREITHSVTDIAKALKNSSELALSEDGLKVKRLAPIIPYNSDDRTVYVESIPSKAGLSWLSTVFEKYGPVAYISLPKYYNSNKIKGFAFIEYKKAEDAQDCLKAFTEMGCKLPTNILPDELVSVKTFEPPPHCENSDPMESLPDEENSNKNDSDDKAKDVGEPKRIKRNRKSETSAKELDGEPPIAKKQRLQSDSDNEKKEMLKDAEADDVVEPKRKLDKSELESSGKKRKSGQQKGLMKLQSAGEEVLEQVQTKSRKRMKWESKSDYTSDDTDSANHEKDTVQPSEDEKENDPSKPEPSDLEDDEGDKTKKSSRNRNLKKRKKSKMHSETLPEGLELSLQVLPKPEWKVLRNKYLTLQRKHYTEMKKALRSKVTNPQCDADLTALTARKSDKEESDVMPPYKLSKYMRKCPEKIPGIIVRVNLPEPCVDVREMKVSTKSHVHVLHVELKQGQSQMYLRFDGAEYAKQFTESGIFNDCHILTGDEENLHWDRVKKEWESRAHGGKRRMRGGDRLRMKIRQVAAPPKIGPSSTPASQPNTKHLRFDD